MIEGPSRRGRRRRLRLALGLLLAPAVAVAGADDGRTSTLVPSGGAEPVDLAVDAAGNGAYQPNEFAVIAPRWRNAGGTTLSLGGTFSNHMGYCPTAPVTREEMSVFLSVTFGLTLYGVS